MMPYVLTLQELSGLYISLGSSLAYLVLQKRTQQFGTTLTLTEQFLASIERPLADYIS
jgi:hypothetical protein